MCVRVVADVVVSGVSECRAGVGFELGEVAAVFAVESVAVGLMLAACGGGELDRCRVVAESTGDQTDPEDFTRHLAWLGAR